MNKAEEQHYLGGFQEFGVINSSIEFSTVIDSGKWTFELRIFVNL